MSINTKIIAFNLPQFHTFPENDKWWGKGFTEWVNVKSAKAIYKNQYEPRIPLGDNYYDLSNLENIISQMKLAKKYGIYGFCYYHYWFNGKLLMQKPLELLRDYKGEKIPYCLCWANEPWTRAWDGKTDVIMPQNYGNDEKKWEKHILYLLSFFKDESYIKIDNRPMLVVYRCSNIQRRNDIFRYYDCKCKEFGFNGIYLVEELNGFQNKPCCEKSSAVLEFEPWFTSNFQRTFSDKIFDKIRKSSFNYKNNTECGRVFSYDETWRRILKFNPNTIDRKVYLGGFPDWDNTPRRGNKANLYIGSNPQKFENYLRKQLQRCDMFHSDYLFINAWNEWGESAYLEPDEKNRYGYLEAVQNALNELR